jgi:hypothetical protein
MRQLLVKPRGLLLTQVLWPQDNSMLRAALTIVSIKCQCDSFKRARRSTPGRI